VDPVPTRAERIAAVVAILATLLLVPAAALGSGIAVVALLFVALTGGTIAKARAGADAIATFGTDSVSDDDPDAERYRERRRRTDERIEGITSTEFDPRLERLLAIGLALLGIGALAALAVGPVDDPRLLLVALFALNAALIGYAASYVGSDD
jgi:hypothetical protein